MSENNMEIVDLSGVSKNQRKLRSLAAGTGDKEVRKEDEVQVHLTR